MSASTVYCIQSKELVAISNHFLAYCSSDTINMLLALKNYKYKNEEISRDGGAKTRIVVVVEYMIYKVHPTAFSE